MAGLFSTFNTATSGIAAQQKALDVTSHNIANANTAGYTRQRVQMEATSPSGVSIDGTTKGMVGTGVNVTDVQRIRDSFLDYQVRDETSIKGTYDSKNEYLGQLQNIMNEPSDSGISTLLGNFFSSWQSLSQNPQSSNARTVVAQQTLTLTDALNNTYNKLQTLKSDCQTSLDSTVSQVNDTLKQIDTLNQQIMNVKSSGNDPNDLMDKRDLLIDTLSQNFNISVDSKSLDGVNIKSQNSDGIQNPNFIQTQNLDQEKRLSYISDIQQTSNPGEYKITYYKNGDMTSDANKVDVYVSGIDADKLKEIDENRVIWANNDGLAIGASVDEGNTQNTHGSNSSDPVDVSQLHLFTPDNGSLKGTTEVQQNIDQYTDQLNSMAKAIAYTVNTVESGRTSVGTPEDSSKIPPDADYMPFFINSDAAKYSTDSNGKSTLSNLSETLNNEVNITAGNITINKQILDDVMQIKTRTNDDKYAYENQNSTDGSTDGKRALAVAQLQNTLVGIQNINSSTTRSDFINSLTTDSNGVNTVNSDQSGMTVDNYFKDTIDTLAVQVQQSNTVVQNQTTLLNSFQQSRDSTSGVSLDEEMTNLIQYQHAYQANAKVISTLDQLLDVVINGLMK